MIVCHCRIVTDKDVAAAVEAGESTLSGVCRRTGAGQVCGGCALSVRRCMDCYDAQNTLPSKESHAAPQSARRRVA